MSVVVPARATDAKLRRLLLALAGQTLAREEIEILVVDDASDPPLQVPPGVRLIRMPRPSGSYAARNAGISEASSSAIAFTDVDCVPDRVWLQAGLRALKHAPRIAGAIELIGAQPPSLVERLDQARFLRQDRYVCEGFGATANLFVRREVFDRVGHFDPRLTSGGDAEHGRRAERAGYRIELAKDAIVRHPCRRELRALLMKAHRVGVGFGQTARLHGVDLSRASARAQDRLQLGRNAPAGERALVAAGMLALHGATMLGALRGYLAGGEGA